MKPIRIYLIYEYRILGELLAKTFGCSPQIDFLGKAASFSQAAASLAREPAQVLMLDVQVGTEVALQMTSDFHSRFGDVKILPFGLSSEEQILKFLERGACSCLLADASLASVLTTLETIRRGEADVTPRIAATVCSRVAELAWERRRRRTLPEVELTRRETEVLVQIADGKCNKEIAHDLAITVPTVKNHVHRILQKLEVRNRRQAIRRAIEHGLMASPLPLTPCRSHLS